MSLVAYGASDESDNSDAEEQGISGNLENDAGEAASYTDVGKISDDDDYTPTNSGHLTSTSAGNTPAHSALSDLPAPKPAVPSPGPMIQGEDELEEEVRPKPSQLADAPKPPPPHKAKQTARIVLPALQQDSDEEDDASKKPKQPASKPGKGGGLFALLPPPVNSKKQTNRPLIPYTLTKRPTPSAAKTTAKNKTSAASVSSTQVDPEDVLPSQKHKSAFNALTGYESDSDEDETIPSGGLNFFSLDSEAQAVSSSSGLKLLKNAAPNVGEDIDQVVSGDSFVDGDSIVRSELSDIGSSVGVGDSKSKVNFTVGAVSSASATTDVSLPTSTTSDDAGDTDNGSDSEDDDDTPPAGVPQVNQDAPLKFSAGQQRAGWSVAPLVAPMMPEMYAARHVGSRAPQWQAQEHYAQDTNPANQEDAASMEQDSGASSSSGIQQYMADEQFLRLAPGSGKRKRSQGEIEIIDANVDDYVDPSELMKGITEESSYQPHRKKDNMPSSQQRRKKQITYLAFQAKERELELKNQWSQNRMTKSHARSKYGF